jgi:pimeloyl-ACP methyl ester carboxylesterase
VAGGARDRSQGFGEPVRLLARALTTLLQIPGLRRAAQWASGRSLLGHLAQVCRCLERGEPDAAGRSLDARVRERVLRGTDPGRPLVVVAHSLGTVVAFEALQRYSGPVRTLVTPGSPLATATAVLHRVLLRPPRTPSPSSGG